MFRLLYVELKTLLIETTFPVPVPLTTTKPFVPLQFRGSVGANVITGIGFIVTVMN